MTIATSRRPAAVAEPRLIASTGPTPFDTDIHDVDLFEVTETWDCRPEGEKAQHAHFRDGVWRVGWLQDEHGQMCWWLPKKMV